MCICFVQVALYSHVQSLDDTTPQERHIAGMASIACGVKSQKPAAIASALKFLRAYQADPGYALNPLRSLHSGRLFPQT